MTDLSIINQIQETLEAEKSGNRDKAHLLVSSIKHPLAYEIHAYLHRKEHDIDNARFWYGKAGVIQFKGSLSEEYQHLVNSFSELKS